MAISSETLIKMAREIRAQAYAPYSHFQVGAAVLTPSGRVFTGVNVENASYGLTVCAERNAIGQMVAAGEQKIVAVAVATSNGVTPCGACRQVLREFGDEVEIWIWAEDTGRVWRTTLAQLLPQAFEQTQLPEE